ncbi:MAG TPA: VWA domain-containing protein [Bryobacteraceae bacterium]|jgi:VWFA-related protein|nr:VWA domain-containing protein [Bryobacteraceae bacterium]
MPQLNLTLFGCTLCCALAGPALAQNAPPAEGAPTIHATVNEVALDLVVRDKKGRLVKNLKPGDVEIYEDGVRQEIRSLRLVVGAEAPAHASPLAQTPDRPAGAEKPEPAGTEALPAEALPLRSADLVCIVFHHLDANTRKWGVAAAQEFIKTQLRPGAWVGVFNLDSRLTLLHAFTTNRDELLRAAAGAFNGSTVDITRAAEAVLNSTPNVQYLVGFTNPGGTGGGVKDLSTTGSVSMAAITGADVSNGPGANAQRGDLVLQREQFIGIEGARQMDQINLLIRQLSTFPGHKTVLLLSPGFTTDGEPDHFQAMLNKANLADLTFYAFDANGLSETSTAQASSMAMQHVAALSQQQPAEAGMSTRNGSMGSAGVVAELSRQDNYLHDAVRTSDSQSGLRALAEGTGGFLVANTNDLQKPFQQIGEDAGTHYEADYHPSSANYDGHFRKIEIKLARADLPNAKVDSRNGYFAIPDFDGSAPLQPFEMAGLVTLNARPLPHAFDLRTAAFQFRPGGSTSQAAVVFELPGSSLTATPLPARRSHRLHASLLAVVKDANGQIVDKFGQDFPYEVPDGQLAGIQAAPIDYTHAFNLPPGHYTVESVLFDREANRASAGTAELDSLPRKGIGLSSVMVVGRADPLTADADANDPFLFHGRDVVPMLDASLPASAKPLVYFVVYPDKSNQETPRIRVEFFVGGEELEQKETELPAPDSFGAVPMLVSAVARPGKCEIRITARQGFQSAVQSVAYTVAAP